MARLFFAHWPAPEARAALAELSLRVAARTGGQAVPAEKIHLTLAFLGEVSEARARSAAEVAAAVRAEAFAIALDRLGSFERSAVAWAGMSRPPQALLALASDLAQGLRASGFAIERRAFAAHFTLARAIRRRLAPEALSSLEWEANTFALVESDLRTGRYRDIGCWPLGKATR